MTLALWEKKKPYREEVVFPTAQLKIPSPHGIFFFFNVHSFWMDFAPLSASFRHCTVRRIYGLWNPVEMDKQ